METLKNKFTIEMVVCDMAGTTIEEDNLVYKTLQNVINKAGYNFSLEEVLAQGAGKEKRQAIESIIAAYGEPAPQNLIDTIFEDFLGSLDQTYRTANISAQPNAEDFFSDLRQRGIRVVLNTGYNRATAEALIAKLGWTIGTTIDGLVTADDVPNNRPHPDMILHAMHQFGIKSGAQVAKIGDSTIDIQEGKNAGCSLSIGVTTGAHTREQLKAAEPEFIANNLLEILPLLAP
ncbi:phosphonatase-like hydrolase [Sphingobacterium shayense]|uniref:phosphonatase-like hydrolase n=1 Tax=Sphingobacterium shayense TaxID=626343 RepID=UPI001C12E49F|nr:phosphonatase-like hydrolase [Sphingobacterium shayense]